MGVPTSEVGYSSPTTGKGDHEVHKGHVVALEKIYISLKFLIKISLNKDFTSVKGPRKGTSLHVPQKRGPYGNRRPFPEP
jgi:hypothetical protein